MFSSWRKVKILFFFEIAVNPYERVAHLDQDSNLERYLAQENGGEIKPPHPFAVGARAHYRLIHGAPGAREKKNQSVVVCGESGAGKVNKTFFNLKTLSFVPFFMFAL